MTRHQSLTAIVFLVGCLFVDSLNPLFVIAHPSLAAESQDKQKKLQAELRQLAKSLATANDKFLEKIGDRCVELDREGVSVRRMLCEAAVNPNAITAQNSIAVLERVSSSTAQSAELLVSVERGNAESTVAVFDKYSTAFGSLRKDRKLDAAISPIIKSVLLKLAPIEKAAIPRPPYSTVSELHRDGLFLIAQLAKDDDDAYADLLSLVTLKADSDDAYFTLRNRALDYIGSATGSSAARSKAAMPALRSVLRYSVDPGGARRSHVYFQNQRADHIPVVISVLGAIGELGSNAAPAASEIRPLQTHPQYGKAAQSALSKIGG